MISYRREIDGLRALAVLPVMLFHAGFETFGGGFVGVDVFFVISGYLITSIILAEKDTGSFSLLDFYERRARRILPALFFVMAASMPFAWMWLAPADMKDFSQSLIAVSAFASNILFWRESGYFDTAAELKPLLHTWSLAVEEQYYLLFPLFILLTWRLGKRSILFILAVIAIASLSVAHWGAYNKPAATFFLLHARAWEFSIGAFIAFYFSNKKNTLNVSYLTKQIGSITGLALILYAVFAFDKDTPFPSLHALAPTIGTALILLFASSATLVGRVLSTKALVGVGLISYSAYLWHQPLFAFARHMSESDVGKLTFIALICTSMLLAWASWKYVEAPFRNRQGFSRKSIFVFSALAMTTFVSLGIWGQKTDGFKSFFIENRLSDEQREMYGLIQKHTGKDLYQHMFDDGDCRFWSKEVDTLQEERFLRCFEKHGKAVIVLGDSHAMNAYNVIAKTNAFPFVYGVAQGGCRPHDNHAYCHYAGFDRFLSQNREKVRSVVFHQSGSYLFKDHQGRVDSRESFSPDAQFEIEMANLLKIKAYLEHLSTQAAVVWLGPFVEARVDFMNPKNWTRTMRLSGKSEEQFSKLELELTRFNSSEKSYRYVSLFGLLRLKSDFLLTDACISYNDIDHFSACGEDLIAIKLRESIHTWLP